MSQNHRRPTASPPPPVTAAVTSRPDGAPKAVYIDTPGAADQWLAAVAGAGAVALDTEGASFHRFVDRIYLLQLSTRSHSAIIDPLDRRPARPPGHDSRKPGDRDRLPRCRLRSPATAPGLRLARHQHLRYASGRAAPRYPRVRSGRAPRTVFRDQARQKHQRADWSMRPLTPGMLDYAAQDTRYLLDLREQLATELRAKGRWSWAAEEFARLEGTHWVAEDPAEAFLRVKGARDLSRRELSSFANWYRGATVSPRNSTARRSASSATRRSSRSARQAPDNRETLAAIRGMPRGMSRRAAANPWRRPPRSRRAGGRRYPRFPRAARWDQRSGSR